MSLLVDSALDNLFYINTEMQINFQYSGRLYMCNFLRTFLDENK